MYLKTVYIENSGPLRRLLLDLPFQSDGSPKPIIFVGGNGSGKTSLLSSFADSLFEAAANHFTNVVQGQGQLQRPWFRVVGGTTVTFGANWGVTLLEYVSGDSRFIFREKAGDVPADELRGRIPASLSPALSWQDAGTAKDFSIPEEIVREEFATGAYVYFPSSRAESPHWLNQASVEVETFDLANRFNKHLRKPIFVERGLSQVKQWLLSLLMETRADIQVVEGLGQQMFGLATGDLTAIQRNQKRWHLMNTIIRKIVGDETARFAWFGRNSPGKIGIEANGRIIASSFDSLSAGQATLLAMFGTLVRYLDDSSSQVELTDGPGICVIDEIDAHMHVDLQFSVLPRLIQLFPKVQFLVSSHSPLFVLGMEKCLGINNIAIIDMPSGHTIAAESYGEFGRAMNAMEQTLAFERAVGERALQPGPPLVLFEGETDPIYVSKAAQLFNRNELNSELRLEWIGAKDSATGQAFNTGVGALNATYSTLKANPQLMNREIILIYDSDANKANTDEGRLHVRSLPGDSRNNRITAGIESLLPESVFTPEMIDESEKRNPNGDQTIIRKIRKMQLCSAICERGRREDFEGFTPLLDLLAGFLPPQSSQSTPSSPAP